MPRWPDIAVSSASADSQQIEAIRASVLAAARFLPLQGVLGAFVHQNPLMRLEESDFWTAISDSESVLGFRGTQTQAAYRRHLAAGRIDPADLRAELRDLLGVRACDALAPETRRDDLWLALLRSPAPPGDAAELAWHLGDGELLTRFVPGVPAVARANLLALTRTWAGSERLAELLDAGCWSGPRPLDPRDGPDARRDAIAALRQGRDEELTLRVLWSACVRAERHSPPALPPADTSTRVQRACVTARLDLPRHVNGIMARFVAAYADQGLAGLRPPALDQRFLFAFAAAQGVSPGSAPPRGSLASSLAAVLAQGDTRPEAVIAHALAELGVPQEDWPAELRRTLLDLRGFAGMLWQLESRPERADRPVPPGTLLDYVAARFIVELHAFRRLAARDHARAAQRPALAAWMTQQAHAAPGIAPAPFGLAAFRLFVAAQFLAADAPWSPVDALDWNPSRCEALIAAVRDCDDATARGVFYRAFERHYRDRALSALRRAPVPGPMAMPAPPSVQMVCCVDAREESFRRHAEEIDPGIETFGAAGFFGVVVRYRGLTDAAARPNCPIVATPAHTAHEIALPHAAPAADRAAKRRRLAGLAAHHADVHRRRPLLGTLLSFAGLASAAPLAAQVLAPRAAARARDLLASVALPATPTSLVFHRHDTDADTDTSASDASPAFAVTDMARIVGNFLREIGLTSRFAPLVIIVGHGSASVNNPHEAAYNCGACGGGRGAVNARAFAMMANDPDVRAALAAEGLSIPGTTRFLAAYHDTCVDTLTYPDAHALPDSHAEAFDRAAATLAQALQRNAHERCRRFETMRLNARSASARRHAEARAADLAQPRAELGNATNALCVVGRRDRTRGLFLDRRAFLMSYDRSVDDAEGTRLAAVLGAVLPVCSGINLQYTFAAASPDQWGCGSKLPHNICGLLGVIDGASGDLRAGLPWQMVEVHEPMRLLVVVEAEPALLAELLQRDAVVRRIVGNAWVRLATLDPESDSVMLYERGRFIPHSLPQHTVLPRVNSSADWYAGSRDHLGFAEVMPATATPTAPAVIATRRAAA